MPFSFSQRDVIAIDTLSKDEILHILNMAEKLEKSPLPHYLKGKILASCFFEPSTRTRLSFEAAMQKLGGTCIGFSEAAHTSTQKGETLSDTFRMIDSFADIAVIRHPLEGAAQCAADSCQIPVINGGDGANEHPTQTLLDLYAIKKTQKKLDDLKIALVGDLKHGRCVHSLAKALAHFNARLYFISPPTLELPKEIYETLRNQGVKFSFHPTFSECLPKLDILYMTRIQKERINDPFTYEQVKNSFHLKAKDLKNAKETLKVLHPLPRVNEIDPSFDSHCSAGYFDQAKGGLFVRQALLSLILGGEIHAH